MKKEACATCSNAMVVLGWAAKRNGVRVWWCARCGSTFLDKLLKGVLVERSATWVPERASTDAGQEKKP